MKLEKDKNLTFDKALEIALQTKMAIKDMEGTHQLEDVKFIKKCQNTFSKDNNNQIPKKKHHSN